MDVNLLPTCDMCNQHIFEGSVFYHCSACSLDPGFDACSKCYGPGVHQIHREYIQAGVYPLFNPYMNMCRVCQRPRVEANGKNLVKVVNRLDVIRNQLGLDASQDGPGAAKYICKNCDIRLMRLRKEQAAPMTISQFRKSCRQQKKSRRQSQDSLIAQNDEVQILQSIENKNTDVVTLTEAENPAPLQMFNAGTNAPVRNFQSGAGSSLELQRRKLTEALKNSHFSKAVKTAESRPFFQKDSAHDLPSTSQNAKKTSTSVNKPVSVISLTDSDDESNGHALDGLTENTSDEEYDFKCVGTVSLVRKVGTEILEFVYDEVVVKIASSKEEGTEEVEKHQSNVVEIDLEADERLENTEDKAASIVETVKAGENGKGSKTNSGTHRNVFESLVDLLEGSSGEESCTVVRDAESNRAAETDNISIAVGTNSKETQRTVKADQPVTIVDVINQSFNMGEENSAELFGKKVSAAGIEKQNPISSVVKKEDGAQNKNSSNIVVKPNEKATEEQESPGYRTNTAVSEMSKVQSVITAQSASLVNENQTVESNIIVIQPIPDKDPPSSAASAAGQAPAKRMKLHAENQIPQNVRHLSDIISMDDRRIRSDNPYDAADNSRKSFDLQMGFLATSAAVQRNQDTFAQLSSVSFPQEQHQQQQSNKRGFRCQICNQDVHGTSVEFYKHMLLHTGERPWSCATCLVTFNLSNSLRQHIQEYRHRSGPVGDNCRYLAELEQKFPNELNTEEGLSAGDFGTEINSARENHVCPMCDKSFHYIQDFRQHKLSHIPQLPSYPCTICQLQLPNVASLQDHIKQAHNEDYLMFCSLCKIGFLHMSQYKLHHEFKHVQHNKAKIQTASAFGSNNGQQNAFSQHIPMISSEQNLPLGYQATVIGHNSRKTISTTGNTVQNQFPPYKSTMHRRGGANHRGYQNQSYHSQQRQVSRTGPMNNPTQFSQWQYPHFAATATQQTGSASQFTQHQQFQSVHQGVQPSWQQMQVTPVQGIQDNTNLAHVANQAYPNQQSVGYNYMGNNYSQPYQYL